MRRQNRSCDQCRRAKRACDAPSLGDMQAGDSSYAASRRSAQDLAFPSSCSYCRKTRKQCTFYWARSQLKRRDASSPSTTATTSATASNDVSAAAARRTSEPEPLRNAIPKPRRAHRYHQPRPDLSSSVPTDSQCQMADAPGSVDFFNPFQQSPPPWTDELACPHPMDPGYTDLSTLPEEPFVPLPMTESGDLNTTGAFDAATINLLPDLPLDGLGASPGGASHVCGLQCSPTNCALSTSAVIDDACDDTVAAPWAASTTFFHPHSQSFSASEVSARPAHHHRRRRRRLTPDTSDIPGFFSQGPGARRFSQGGDNHVSSLAPWTLYGGGGGSSLSPFSLSPFSAEHVAMTTTNNHLISENLMRIYHDVFENALSCWLNEHTCPYKMPPRGAAGRSATRWVTVTAPTSTPTAGKAAIAEDGNYEPMQTEFGAAWSNRIYRRVLKLERAARGAGLVRLTAAQDRAASRALHLAMMAFATQWAQGSRRERERYNRRSASVSAEQDPQFSYPNGGVEEEDPLSSASASAAIAEEFDRTLQRSFWSQAKMALQECADIESFRVVCAEIILGLTMKPDDEGIDELELGVSDFGERRGSSCPGGDDCGVNGGNSNGTESLLSRIEGVIARDGPPTFLERAARKIHNLKFRFDARETGLDGWLKKSLPTSSPGQGDPIHAMSLEDRRTIGLLYWLALMFDTISSSMNQRPVSVSDEDCQHDTADYETGLEPEASHAAVNGTSDAGSCNNGAHDNTDMPWWDSGCSSSSLSPALRWPCSYEAAAQAVSGSGPVKVLLFRHVANLQSLVRGTSNNTSDEAVERTIRKAMAVHRYWDATYGAFFADLLAQYDTVSPRIRSWFVCILAHWHLAALILADLIEFVDDRGLGSAPASASRRAAGLAAFLRRSSASQLADLARVSTVAMPTPSSWPPPPSSSTPASSTSPSSSARNNSAFLDTNNAPADFHFAVRDGGSILTEPWTMILVRAFARATIFFLDEAADARPGGRRQDRRETAGQADAVRRAEECVKALWYLGKKSDISRRIAEILSKELGPLLLSLGV